MEEEQDADSGDGGTETERETEGRFDDIEDYEPTPEVQGNWEGETSFKESAE